MQCIPWSYQPGTISSPKVRLHYCRQRFAQLCKSIKPTSVLKRQDSARHLSLITTCRQDRWEPILHQRLIRLRKPLLHTRRTVSTQPAALWHNPRFLRLLQSIASPQKSCAPNTATGAGRRKKQLPQGVGAVQRSRCRIRPFTLGRPATTHTLAHGLPRE